MTTHLSPSGVGCTKILKEGNAWGTVVNMYSFVAGERQ